ncbi:MAG: DEAD/DEAH box helicase [Armatimonadota bacterium]|nr:DEAD/DEAH box helicase [Armatimonadota bacterium]
MTSDEFLAALKSRPEYRRQIVHAERIPARPARYAPLEAPLHPLIEQALKRQGIEQFYTHQSSAISAALRGEHVIVVTPTASGKTLCYNVPALQSILEREQNRALYMFPTKALAQDQLGKLRELGLPVKAATYDGDTPTHERRFIKRSSQIILTNPDMLHVGILPYHVTWASFFKNLKYVVIDEIHSYRGVFGSNVANVLRRLRRICAHYGAEPQFIASSATIANPDKLMETLTGGIHPSTVVDDGSPSGEKIFVFWNPPYVGKAGERRSANSEATFLFTELTRARIRSIVFTRARKTAELILRYARAQLIEEGSPHLADRIMSYRAGYRPEERREIEQRLFHGDLIGVTSTTALELGVDIGGLDACVLTGYPGTVASAWQQAGRAGRGVEQSLAVMIALDNPLDQFLMRSPNYFFEQNHEMAVVDPANPYLLAHHALCAAYELPITEQDFAVFGERLGEVLTVLTEAGQLMYRGRWFWAGGEYPAAQVNIRSASSESYQIIDIGANPIPAGPPPDTIPPAAVRGSPAPAPPIPPGALPGGPPAGGAVRGSPAPAPFPIPPGILPGGRSPGGRGAVLGTVDSSRVFETVHPGAVYLHAGESYVVHKLDLTTKIAYVMQGDVNYYTEPATTTDLDVREIVETGCFGPTLECGDSSPLSPHIECGGSTPLSPSPNPAATRFYGDVSVTNRVVGYRRKQLFSDELLDTRDLDLPPTTMQTEAVWFPVPRRMADILIGRNFDLSGTIHAIEHAAIGILPLFAMCDRMDIGGVSNPMHVATNGLPTIFIYDGYSGGVGIARNGYDHLEELLEATLKTIEDCPCDDGCPSCVQSPKCGNNNEPLDKNGAAFLLRMMLGESGGSGGPEA